MDRNKLRFLRCVSFSFSWFFSLFALLGWPWELISASDKEQARLKRLSVADDELPLSPRPRCGYEESVEKYCGLRFSFLSHKDSAWLPAFGEIDSDESNNRQTINRHEIRVTEGFSSLPLVFIWAYKLAHQMQGEQSVLSRANDWELLSSSLILSVLLISSRIDIEFPIQLLKFQAQPHASCIFHPDWWLLDSEFWIDISIRESGHRREMLIFAILFDLSEIGPVAATLLIVFIFVFKFPARGSSSK